MIPPELSQAVSEGGSRVSSATRTEGQAGRLTPDDMSIGLEVEAVDQVVPESIPAIGVDNLGRHSRDEVGRAQGAVVGRRVELRMGRRYQRPTIARRRMGTDSPCASR